MVLNIGLAFNFLLLTCRQTYSIQDHNLCLTGTAEIPLVGKYANTIIPAEKLPGTLLIRNCVQHDRILCCGLCCILCAVLCCVVLCCTVLYYVVLLLLVYSCVKFVFMCSTVKMVGYGHSFRVETGHRGQHSKGLYRVVRICHLGKTKQKQKKL